MNNGERETDRREFEQHIALQIYMSLEREASGELIWETYVVYSFSAAQLRDNGEVNGEEDMNGEDWDGEDRDQEMDGDGENIGSNKGGSINDEYNDWW